MSLLSMLGSSGSSSGVGAAGGASPWGAIIQAINETMTGMGKEFNKQQAERNNVPLLNAGKYGQQNASGSNANLDNSLDKDARKVAGVSEGGATPQTQNNSLLGSLGNSFMDWLRQGRS